MSAGGSTASTSQSSTCNDANHNKLCEEDSVDIFEIWSHLVKNWSVESKRNPQRIKQLVRQGIPGPVRALVWQLLCSADHDNARCLYAEFIRASSPHEKAIRRDVTRTFPGHKFFDESGRGQHSLFSVMKAYSLYDREVGYCQGSAFVVGMLLLLMPEEEAFGVLLKLMEDYRLRELYKPSMSQLGLCLFQLECAVQDQMPDLSMHFRNVGIDTTMYASSWFLTMFSSTLPLDLAFRTMDIFLSEGMEIVFRVALAILQLCRVELFSLDMEGILRYLQRDLAEQFDQDHERLFSVAFEVAYNKKKMQKFEKDYLVKRSKDQEEAAELRGIKAENRLLRQRLEYLEQESGSLADRLVDKQVSLAQGAEDLVTLNHEMARLRRLHSGVKEQLEDAYDTIRSLLTKKDDHVDIGVQVDDSTMIEHIQALQEELVQSQARETSLRSTIKDQTRRIDELETAYKRLKELPPENSIANIQEELIAVKMREAEANLSLKEVRQKFIELSNEWKASTSRVLAPVGEGADDAAYIRRVNVKDAAAASGRIQELEDLLTGVRIREASMMVELKEMRQRVMELETQNHMCSNQIRRQDEELKKLAAEHEKCSATEKEYQLQLLEERVRASDLESQLKEITVLSKLDEAELLHVNGELKNKICELESRLMECWTRQELNRSSAIEEDSEDDEETTTTQISVSHENASANALLDQETLCSDNELIVSIK
uniref:Rab-GAP TBC domain-containing protein n=1 Tax=Trichuris muris TaxID=70415 RepID=A0A5S6R3M8_TRIMR